MRNIDQLTFIEVLHLTSSVEFLGCEEIAICGEL